MRKCIADAEIQEAFVLFDKNADGRVTCAELNVVMRSLGQNPTATELLDMIKDVDRAGKGFLDFSDFLNMFKSKNAEDMFEVAMIEAFRVFDTDGDGYIGRRDLKNVMKDLGENLTDEEADEMIRESDYNGDGQLDLNGKLVSFNIFNS
ncbi:neo-calmodulin-like [Haliotis rubra]|uniref:neo-calmodulin-like n=1 Tax=Haliotis rubra TaxID=36100 RepID=UPI001EE5FB49|nr:neo-calmodulin-like [Haliotis rubra]